MDSPTSNDAISHGLNRKPGPYAGGKSRPSFSEWVALYWSDIVTMALLGAVGLGVYFAHPAPSRSFPVTSQDGNVVIPDFAYPLRHEVVPIWLAALLAFIIPFFFFSLFQLRIRSFEEINCATFGLLYSLITAAVFQVMLKWLIGGLRPHFLAVCKPDLTRMQGNGFNNIMYDRTVCTGDESEIDDSLESFVSGHTTAAFAGFVYLSLWFNGHLKIFADYRPHYIKMVLFFAPLLGATLIGGALTIDAYHNWYDIVAGGIIGTANAFAAYRMSYASIWDFRFNHIPLPRLPHSFIPTGHYNGGRFPYDLNEPNLASNPPPFARTGGWGQPGAPVGGAPGDALKFGAGRGANGSSSKPGNHRGEDAV